MAAKLQSWWQQIKKHRIPIGVVGIGLVVVIVLINVGYLFDWTGFNGYNKVTIAHIISGTNTGTVTKTEEYQPGKTLWDWLQLILIPLGLGVVALLFNLATTRTEQKIAAQRYAQDQKIALDKQREDLLQAYLDCLAELMLEKQLRSSAVDAEVRNFARVRTITILFQLDARRIGYIFAFLRESGLMSNKPNSSIVSFFGSDLRKINLSQANLYEADLSGANLYEADLSGANLGETNLSGANLSRANLSGANLSGANLSGANLGEANLSRTNLRTAHLYKAHLYEAHLGEADLREANLSGANLSRADLRETNLSGTNLSRAYLSRANLYEADLSGANLREAFLFGADLREADLREANLSGASLGEADFTRAVITEEQLKEAKSLKGAIMLDGSKRP